MKKIVFCLFSILALPVALLRAEDAAAPLELIGLDGKAAVSIVVADDAIPAEKTAAKELKKYLDQITGASFAIKSEANSGPSEPQIVVGAGQRAKDLLGDGFDWKQIGSDGIVLQSGPNWLVLAGDRPRGSLYAVYELLENVGGVRFWYSGATLVPSNPHLAIPAQATVYTPPFPYREHFNAVTCLGVNGKVDEAYTTQLRENGHFNHQSEEWGGHYTIIGWCHTLPELIPVETYFKDHPDWFSDPANGNKPSTAATGSPLNPKDHAFHGQLNLTAPGLAEEVAKNALEKIRKDPKAGFISISQNDGGGNFCTGPVNDAILKKEGSQSGVLIDFVNQVAEIIHQEYPDFRVETLAYQDSLRPPKTARPGDNVIIRFAPIGADYGRPIDSAENKETHDFIQEWSAIAPQLFIWNYFNNFDNCMVPHPNWAGVASDLRFFVAHHAKGVFEQGNNYTNGVGDFVELRSWLVGKLLWNPNLDQDALINEFLTGYYGPVAGPLMRQYLDLYENAFLASKKRLGNDSTYMNIEKMTEATKLFDQAREAVKDDPVLADRLARVRISLDLVWLTDYKKLKGEAQVKGVEFLGPPDFEKGIEDFLVTAKGFGVSRMGETVGLDVWLKRIHQRNQ